MKKVLLVSTVSGFVPQFEMNNVRILQKLGYEVHYASNFNNPIYRNDMLKIGENSIIKHQINFVRSPFKIIENTKAYLELNCLLKNIKFEIIHCHTPMGGLIARVAARKFKFIKVIYTAHGFHFYKGASIKLWLLSYPIEKWLARYTDILITINKEDFNRAKDFQLKKNGRIEYIPGVGVDTDFFIKSSVDTIKKRNELGIDKNAFIIITVGELNLNKNQIVVLQALAKLKNDSINYIICGDGKMKYNLQELCKKLNIQNQVFFLGHRQDIPELLGISNCFVFPSKREGLGIAAIEAMAVGLPLVVARNRGTLEYAEEGKTGYICDANDIDAFAYAIDKLYKDEQLCHRYGRYNQNIALTRFDINKVSYFMEGIYKNY